jgi:general secretion pathway protein I
VRRTASRTRPRGFTLIEVLVALLVVALGVAALMSSMLTAANSTARLRDRAYAEWVAANRIVEVRVAQDFPTLGRSEGVVRLADRDWDWRQDVRATSIEGVVQIVVDVRPRGAEGWLLTLSGARGRDIIVADGADGLWDTAERTPP